MSAEVKTKQPQLTDVVLRQWRLMRSADAGGAYIKAHDAAKSGVRFTSEMRAQSPGFGDTYLPIPGGFVAHWLNGGQKMWSDYLERAQFPQIITPAVDAMIGIIHKAEWKIELPSNMEFIREASTDDEQPLEGFARRVTRELLLMGRYEIAVDAPKGGGNPYLVGQKAESLINWDTDFYVFNESGMVRTGFEWEEVERYRIHELDKSGYYVQHLVDGDGEPVEDPSEPSTASDRLTFVPVVVAGACDITLDVEDPPLIGAGESAVAIYRLDADWRHQLYMSGQETLVVDNGDIPSAIGPAVGIEIHSTSDMPASVYYVSPTCVGIQAHERAIEDQWETAAKAGAKLFDDGSAIESGEARRMRQNAESATLQTIANSSAAALERALRFMAEMMGSNPNDVIVTPPRNLLDAPIGAEDVLRMVQGYRDGGYSFETLYENLQKGQFASDERTADDELSMMNTDFKDEVDPSDI